MPVQYCVPTQTDTYSINERNGYYFGLTAASMGSGQKIRMKRWKSEHGRAQPEANWPNFRSLDVKGAEKKRHKNCN